MDEERLYTKELIVAVVHEVLAYCAETCGTEATVDVDEYGGIHIHIQNPPIDYKESSC